MENNSTVKERQQKDKQKLVETLKEMPIIQVACKRIGISRDTYYRWRREDRDFRRQGEDAMQHGFEYINDLSESQILTLIREKKMPAITLWLKHHHPRYGSQTKSYTPIAKDEDLTPEEQKVVIEALSLVSNKPIKRHRNEGNRPSIS